MTQRENACRREQSWVFPFRAEARWTAMAEEAMVPAVAEGADLSSAAEVTRSKRASILETYF